MARPALRRANVDEAAWLHVDCRHRARAGHRREQCDFQLLQWSVVASASLSATGAACVARRDCDESRRRFARRLMAELSGLARAESSLLGSGLLSRHHIHADGSRRRGGIVRGVYLGEVFRDAWRSAAIGTRLYA